MVQQGNTDTHRINAGYITYMHYLPRFSSCLFLIVNYIVAKDTIVPCIFSMVDVSPNIPDKLQVDDPHLPPKTPKDY